MLMLGAVLAGRAAALAQDGKEMAYGKHLSQQCTACHRIDGTSEGIPSIIGWEKEQFVAALTSYKENTRKNEVMVSMAQTLGDREMQALATYFGSLKTPAHKAPAKKK